MQNIQAIFFDLDGTLADTAPDLAQALNATLQAHGKPPLPFEKIRPVVSHGGIAMIKLGFELGPEHEQYNAIREYFLQHYLQNIATHTRLFDGMAELLQQIEQRNIKWGVVTNKPGWLTLPLMRALNLSERAACIVSGDTVSKAKPHPEPMLYACQQAGVEPGATVYIGDAERDIQAGRAAGMKTIAALFGYLLEDDIPENWQADAMIQSPADTWSAIAQWTT